MRWWVRLVASLVLGAACSAQAQIAFRSAANGTSAAGGTGGITYINSGAAATRNNCGNINPAIPAGNVGDVLVALVNARENGATVTMAGWTQAYSDIFPGAVELQVNIFYRVATGGDPNTVAQSGTCSSIGAQIARFRNVDPTQPLETSPIAAGNVARQNADHIDTGSQTTTLADSMLLVAAFADDDRTVTQGGGWSQAFDSALNVTADLALSLHYQLQTATGTYSIANWDLSGNGSDNTYGVILSLRPATPASPLTINVPAGTVANDVMIASITIRPCSNTSGGACTTTINAPAGWTQVGTTIDQTTGAGTGGYGHRLAVYRRVASGSEPASYTWSFGGTPLHAGAAGTISSFSGVDTANPVVANAGQATGAAANHVAPGINTGTVTNTMLVNTFTANSSGTWTAPGGTTERSDVASLTVPDDLGLSLETTTQPIAAAGATGTRTATQSSPPTNDTGATYSLALRPGATVTHYTISLLATTVANCDYAEVTIVGHDASHTPVNVPSSRTVTLTTSTGTGVWQAGLVAGTGTWLPSGTNNGTATYTWPGGESGFTVRLRQSAVTNLSVNLTDGSAAEGAGAEDPTIAFVNSAFRISNGANAPLNIGAQIAGKPSNVGFGSQSLFLQAVRTDTSTGACVSLFPINTDVSIEVGAQCNNPATCSQNLTLVSSALSSNTRSFVPNGSFAGAMNFRFTTGNAEAPFSLNYLDAGQLTLQFRAPRPSPPANQFVTGTSNAFVTRPFGFAFPGVTHATTSGAAVLAAAGDNFSLTLGAYRWAAGQDADVNGIPDAGANITANGLTPNFAAVTTLTATGNLPGVSNGSITRATGGSDIAAGEWTGGTATVTNWRYSEVGNAFLGASSSDYLGDSAADIAGSSGLDGTGNAGGYVGRFRPKHFALSAVSVANRSDLACGGAWTYMGERFRLVFTLTAQNAQNATTTNYTGSYAKLDPALFATWALGARDGTTNLTPRIDTSIASTATGSWSNGVASNVTLTTNVQRNTPDNPDGPFTLVNFGIAPSDADTVAMNTLDFDADNNAVNERKALGIGTEVRFGILRIENAVGSEKLALPIRMETQYWAGSGIGFRRNTDDSCTQIARQNITLDPYTGNLNACETMVNQATVTFGSGLGTIDLAAPGAANDGTVLLTANLLNASGNYCNAVGGGPGLAATSAGLSYLRVRRTGGSWTDNPSARAAFGLYGGQPNSFIYTRENY
jgi:hypothetical protein